MDIGKSIKASKNLSCILQISLILEILVAVAIELTMCTDNNWLALVSDV